MFYKGLKIDKMVQFSRKVYQTVLLCFFLLVGNSGCKDDYTSIIPYVPINMNINPINLIELKIPGGSFYFKNAGFGGVIVVNNWGDATTPFLAFDAACTYEVSSLTRVAVKENGSVTATCPKCGSQFMLFGGNGSPNIGPATEPLRQYQTSYIGGLITVRN